MLKFEFSSHAEWLRWRLTGLGSSDASAVMDKSKWSCPMQLWALRTNRIRPQKQTAAMRRGIALEPAARVAYEQKYGIEMPKAYGQSERFPWMLASYDGANFEIRGGLEIKLAGQGDHLIAKRGRVPEHYEWQLRAQLAVADGELDWMDYWSFTGHHGHRVRLWRELKLEKKLVAETEKMWRYIREDVPPPRLSELVVASSAMATPSALAHQHLDRGTNVFQFRRTR